METYALLIVGIVLVVMGVINMMGNISTIHSYNRKNVKEEDIPKYGRAVGIGTCIVGVGLVAGFVLDLLKLSDILPLVLVPTVVIGLGFILYGQFKYNKGLF